MISIESRKKMLMGVFFCLAFLLLESTSLSEALKVNFLFRHVTIPLYQWLFVFGFVVIWKRLFDICWREALAKGLFLGMAFCLYLPLLNTQGRIWLGSPISRIYILYITGFTMAATTLAAALGAIALRAAIYDKIKTAPSFFRDPIFFPLLLLAAYGTAFFYRNCHMKEAAILSVIFPAAIFYISENRFASSVEALSLSVKRMAVKLLDFRVLIPAIFIFALVVRLIFLFNLLGIEGQRYPYASDDGLSYDDYGWKGVKDPMIYIRNSPFMFMMYYSAFLTLVYSVFGHSYAAAGIMQSIINAAMCVIVFILAYRMFRSRAVAGLAYLGAAINTTLIQMSVVLGTEALFIPMLVFFIFFLFLYMESESRARSILFVALAGLALGIASIIRELALGIFPFAAMWILFWGRRYPSRALLKRIADIAIIFVMMILPILPITYVNYKNTSRFCLIYTTDRPSWDCNSAYGEDIVPSNMKLVELGIKNPISEPMKSLDIVVKSPVKFMRALGAIVPKRMRNLYFWPNFGFFDPVYLINNSRYPNSYASHLEFYAIVTFFAGFIIFIFSKTVSGGSKALILIPIVFYTIFHGIFFLSHSSRYRSPMEPFLAIVFAFGVYKIMKSLGRQR